MKPQKIIRARDEGCDCVVLRELRNIVLAHMIHVIE